MSLLPDHMKSNAWADEVAPLAPHLCMPMESTNGGDSRHQTASNIGQKWDAHILVNTGMTSGSGAGYSSDLPQH